MINYKLSIRINQSNIQLFYNQYNLCDQLFQYALGRHLAVLHGTALLYELSALQRDPQRSFALDAFGHVGRVASPSELWAIRGFNHPFFDKRGINQRLLGRKIVREQGFYFQPHVLQAPDQVLLSGYWQSERYFDAIRPQLLADLQLREPLPTHNAPLLDYLRRRPTVALHIRRGDYLRAATQRTHGLCSAQYYHAAQAYLAARYEGLQLLVFTDDPTWASASFRSAMPLLIAQGNEQHPWADLWLMSQCAHHITANSTFSWWGAWLSTQPAGTVITPARWFADPSFESPDRVPRHWIQL